MRRNVTANPFFKNSARSVKKKIGLSTIHIQILRYLHVIRLNASHELLMIKYKNQIKLTALRNMGTTKNGLVKRSLSGEKIVGWVVEMYTHQP